MANILHIVNSFDPAGDTARCVKELQKYSRHRHELVVKSRHPFQEQFQYEEAPLTEANVTQEDILDLKGWADAIIYGFVGPEDGWNFPNKPCGFRNATAYYNRKQDKFYATYDTTAKDFTKFNLIGTNHLGAEDFLSFLGSEVHFLPSLIPLERYVPCWTRRNHCVSMIKNPEKFYNAQYAHSPSRQYLCGLSHDKILEARRKYASIVIDNTLEGHYGLASLEAMALGLPSVVYNHHKTIEQLWKISDVFPPGLLNLGYDEDVVPIVNANLNKSVSERQFIREWMQDFYRSEHLITKFWDPFADQLEALL